MHLGRVLMNQGKFADAEVLLKETLAIAVRIHPESAPLVLSIRVYHGECLLRLKRFEEARTILQPACVELERSRGEADPELKSVRGHLAQIRRVLGEPDPEAE